MKIKQLKLVLHHQKPCEPSWDSMVADLSAAAALALLLCCAATAAADDRATPHTEWPDPSVTRLDCSFRRLVLQRAQAVQTFRSSADHAAMHDSLELTRLCGDPRPSVRLVISSLHIDHVVAFWVEWPKVQGGCMQWACDIRGTLTSALSACAVHDPNMLHFGHECSCR